MRSDQVLDAATARLRPSRWGALPLFLGLLLALRLSYGALVSIQPRLILLATLILVGVHLLAPMAWQWTGDTRLRAGILRGTVQALAWNTAWLMLVVHLTSARIHATPAHVVRQALADGPHLPGWTLFLAIHLPLAFLAGWFVAEKEAAEAERALSDQARRASEEAARQAQVRALQAQLDPHVLYNALGGLAELVRQDPATAEEALLDLADLYRALTGLGQRATITLGEERGLLERLLALESLRLGSRLRSAWDWPEALDAEPVPPLLVQPLVENALKHGIAPCETGGELRLSARRDGADLVLRVANTGLPLADHPDGTGLGNLRARLALTGRSADLQLLREGAWTVAQLRLRPAVPA